MAANHQIDLRMVWLEEAGITSGKVVDKITEKEALGKRLTPSETEYAKICGAYLYLFRLAKENRLFDEEDDFLTKFETIH